MTVLRHTTMYAAALLLAAISFPGLASSQILSGTVFKDTNGNPIEAHGGGMIKVGNTYYWIGENKSQNSSLFYANSCYSSTDLQHWTFVGNPLSQQSSGDLGPNRVVERPKIIYNKSTSLYVMYMHIDASDYSEAKVGVATSSTVCGTYSYRGSFQPLGFQSRDMGLFQDSDGTAYLLSEDRANGLRVDLLSSDYLSVTKNVALLQDMEAPAMIRIGSTYYLFSSYLSGWSANDNQYTTASSPSGPWASMTNFAPSGTHTFSSQTAYVLPISGSSGTTYMYMGDQWNPNAFPTSGYVWLPLTISGKSVSMAWYNAWTPNTSTGTWAPTATGVQTGVPLQIINQSSGLCLDVYKASTSNGGQMDQYTCNGGQNQNWILTDEGNGQYQVSSQGSGLVLEDPGFNTATGTVLDQYTWDGGNNQRWKFNAVSTSGFFTINNVANQYCADVLNASTSAGASVDQYTCNNGTNQAWRLVY